LSRYFLAPVPVTEVGACWTQHPTLFAAPTKEPDAAKRALLVLKWILVALKSQFYIGGDPTVSIKKPLNAFLGELFFASWNEGKATSNLAAEQVSHHPPITAVYMWDKVSQVLHCVATELANLVVFVVILLTTSASIGLRVLAVDCRLLCSKWSCSESSNGPCTLHFKPRERVSV
jgi:hypothetical protein